MAHVLSGRAETPTQSKILTYVRDEGPLSRMDLAARLNVSRTTVAAEVSRLVDLGLAEDGGPAASRGGRRSTLVDLDSDLRFIGVELGATSLRIAMTDGRLGVIARASTPRADIRRGPEVVLAEVIENVRKLLADQGVERPAGIGVGVPGPVDFQAGVPVSPPIMPGWDGYPVRDALSRELGSPVLLDNDVNVMALGEQHNGIARSASDFLLVKIGTGIGCGIVVQRHLYRGADGCAGDIGHSRLEPNGPVCACGNHGCLEAFFGGAALARDATAAARAGRSGVLVDLLEQHGALTAEHVGRAVAQGDPVALQLVRDGGR